MDTCEDGSLRGYPSQTISTPAMPDVAYSFSFAERMSYLRKYGSHCMSYSTLQPGMQYFDIPGKGFIAYTCRWGIRAVLADPVCDVRDREGMIAAFLQTKMCTGFAQVSPPVADLLHEKFGFYATQFGVESIVDLQNWDLKGKKKQVVRTSVNQAAKKGITIEENCHEDRYRKLSEQWVKTRKVKNREIRFLIRPMNMEHQEETRRFFAYLDGQLVGFIFFDPLFADGRVVGYVPNISRFAETFRQGIFYAIMVHAMETFKNEGLRELHLGLSPFVVVDKKRPYETGLIKKLLRLFFEHGNRVYSFRGIYFTKSRFGGKDCETFCCHKGKFPFREIITLFRISNLI